MARMGAIKKNPPARTKTQANAPLKTSAQAIIALIPAKTLAFDEAVNVTLGLPFVRTSPDHGTALDIAGTGKANPSSFIAALRMADQMCRASASASARTNRSA